MNDMNDNSGDGADDHEPGDVNGNVDPAWAKKQSRAGQRPPSVPRDGGTAGARPPRQRRPRRDAPTEGVQEPSAVARAGDFAPSLAPSEHEPSSGNPDFVSTSSETVEPGAGPQLTDDASSPRQPGGERRSRGMRRSRRGDRERAPQASDNRQQAAVLLGDDATLAGERDDRLTSVTPNLNEENSEIANPANPGAFGDPSRPMDRSARRNRNRNRHRESHEARREREAIRAGAEAPLDLIDETTGESVENTAEGERLHKVLAQQGLGSRREMESLIQAGAIEVNGKPAQVGQVVNESDRVFVKRRKVNIKLGDDKPRILIYHKPPGEIVSRDDPEQRDTVFDRLPKPDHGKWVAMGRLDYNTEGLLLFTTYGELANRMMHPRYEIMREYSVRILGELTPEQEDELIDGIELDDGPARVLSLDRIDRDSEGANHWYRITINEGRNREVRRMFEHLGLTVSRLLRTRYGVVNMPSWLKRGQYKLLDENDTFNVLESVGLRSRKKLEKAARFGGARGKIPQGPVGPMRSASEHDAIWTGAPAPGAGLPGARDRRGANSRTGRDGRVRGRGGDGENFGASLSLQQQQFPGFGGGAAAAADAAAPRRGRPQHRVRGPGGDVNGNVAPGYRAGGGQANPRGRNQARRGRGPSQNPNVGANEFDPNNAVQGGAAVEGAAGNAPNQRNGRGRNDRRGRNNQGGRRQSAPPNARFAADGTPLPAASGDAPAVGGDARAFAPDGTPNAGNNRRRNNRGRRNNGRGPREPRVDGGAGGEPSAPVPPASSDE